jgi:2-keto-4-pentenoate hydratase
MSRSSDIAAELLRQHRERVPFQPMIADDSAGALSLAYDVQEIVVRALRARGEGDVAGWKIGLTSQRMQQMCGVDQPIAGAILARRVHASGASVDAAAYGRLGIEGELAVRIARPIAAGADVTTVLAGIDQVCPAFELIDDRGADYSRLSASSIAADNSWNAGIVLGPPASVPAVGLNGFAAKLTLNGEQVDSGVTDAALGNPLLVVSWLAGHLSARGGELQAGQWVLTGSIVTTKFPRPGDRLRLAIERIGDVSVAVL